MSPTGSGHEATSSGRGVREHARFLGVRLRDMLVVASLSVVSGLMQAAILLIVVSAAAELSPGAEDLRRSFGPVDLSGFSTGELLGIGVLLVLVALGVELIAAFVAARLSSNAQRRLRIDLMRHFSEASWATQQAERRGELDQLVTANVNWASNVIVSATTAVGALGAFLTLFVAALVIDPFSALLVVVGMAGLLLLVRPLTQRAKRLSLRNTSANRTFASELSEHISLLKELRAFGVVDASRSALDEVAVESSQILYRSRLLNKASTGLFRMAALILILLILAVVNAVGASDLLALTTVVLLLVRSLSYAQSLQSSYHMMGEASGWIDELRERDAMFQEHREERTEPTETAGPVSGAISVGRVSFSYAEDRAVLQDVSFEVGAGAALGVVGPSGAGKTTLLELLLRLRHPSTGEILLGGRRSDEIGAGDWHAAVAFVPQEPHLLRTSVADNVRFYRPGLSDDDVQRALEAAQVAEEVRGWPAGIHSPVGELGTAVSGGQRQRIAIARALVARPRVLLLDEPTSSLDGRSEVLIMETLRALRGDVTLVVIAHRMSTLSICDRILVLEAGRVTAFGTPAEVGDVSAFYRHAQQLSVSGGA